MKKISLQNQKLMRSNKISQKKQFLKTGRFAQDVLKMCSAQDILKMCSVDKNKNKILSEIMEKESKKRRTNIQVK